MKKIKLIFLFTIILLWAAALFKLHSLINQYGAETKPPASYEKDFSEKKEKKKTPAEAFFLEYINNLYSDYYDILNIKVYDYFLPDKKTETAETGGYTHSFFVVIEKKLRYDSVFKLPFVAGMKKAVDELGGLRKAVNLYNRKTAELKTYIGLKQIENNIFKVVFKEPDNFDSAEVLIATYHEEIPASALKPPDSAAIFNNGYQFISSYIANNVSKVKYNNAAAVKYADTYTSNPVNAETNETVWNKAYKTYENDCANFVSQCLLEGGVKTTSLWYPESLYWIRTGSPKYAKTDGITSYMQKCNAFYLTNHNAVSAGGFICLTKESHVVMVTSNDSITVLFNGHTNDRKRVSFPNPGQKDALYLTPNK